MQFFKLFTVVKYLEMKFY